MAIVRGREGGNKRKENRRTRLNDFEEGNEEREISFFAGQRARDATFPVQTTAKKVYLGLFPAACSPAIRIFSLALRRAFLPTRVSFVTVPPYHLRVQGKPGKSWEIYLNVKDIVVELSLTAKREKREGRSRHGKRNELANLSEFQLDFRSTHARLGARETAAILISCYRAVPARRRKRRGRGISRRFRPRLTRTFPPLHSVSPVGASSRMISSSIVSVSSFIERSRWTIELYAQWLARPTPTKDGYRFERTAWLSSRLD